MAASTTSPAAASPETEYSVEVNDVTMIFNMSSEQLNSLKEYFIKLARHELFFSEFRALKHISFKVRRGEVVGLVGTNGSGKSTMLKVIAGVLEPSEGNCIVRGNIAPLIELGAGFDLELTARENIYLNGSLLGYTESFIDEHFQEIIDFAELPDFVDMPMKNFSSGMVARIAFAIATVTEPDILIVDETLSVGDVFFQEKCEKRIKHFIDSGDVTVLFVSHSLQQVERICQRAVWIEKGDLRMDGPVAEVCQAYRNQMAFSDVTEKTPHARDIWWAVGANICKGMPGGTFDPDASVTREQLMAFLHRMDGNAVADLTDSPFDDVTEDMLHFGDIMWAIESGVCGPDPSGTFRPHDATTHGEVMVFLQRMSAYSLAAHPEAQADSHIHEDKADGTEPGIDSKASAQAARPAPASFTDVPNDSPYADSVAWAVENGVCAGSGSGSFNPEATATRGEVMAFLHRLVELNLIAFDEP